MNKFWNRIFVLLTVFFVVSLNCSVVLAQRKTHIKGFAGAQTAIENRRAKIRKILQEFYDGSKFPGAVVGVAFGDGSSSAVAIGYANRDTKTPMRESDLLHGGSVGKTFFAALALQLIAEKRIKLDDLITKYLEKEAWLSRLPNGEAITVRMLLNHTSWLMAISFHWARHQRRARDVDDERSLTARPLHAVVDCGCR